MKKSNSYLKKLWNGGAREKGLVCYFAHFGSLMPDKATCKDCEDLKEKSCAGRGFTYEGVAECMLQKVISGDFDVEFTKEGMISMDYGLICKKLVVNA